MIATLCCRGEFATVCMNVALLGTFVFLGVHHLNGQGEEKADRGLAVELFESKKKGLQRFPG